MQQAALGVASLALVSGVLEVIWCNREDMKNNFGDGSTTCLIELYNMFFYMIAAFVLVLASAYELAFADTKQGVRGLQMLVVLVLAGAAFVAFFKKYSDDTKERIAA